MAILIKRYANRKLYNTETSRYITLKGIAKLLDEGEEVRVIDKETGEDITQVALSQILVGNERAKENPSDTLLTQILSRGSDALYGALKKSVDDATDFQDRVRQFVHQKDSQGRGGLGVHDAGSGNEARSPFSMADARGSDREDDEGDSRSDGASRWGRLSSLSELRETIHSAVGNALELPELGDFPRKRDFDELNRNLERVADAIEGLERSLRAQQRAAEPAPPRAVAGAGDHLRGHDPD